MTCYSYYLNNPLKYTDPSGYSYKPDYWDGASGGGLEYLNPFFDAGLQGGIIGSGNHWSNQIYAGGYTEYRNFMVMGSSSFNNIYGTGATDIALRLLSNPQLFSQWVSGETSIEDITRNGGYYEDYHQVNTITFDLGNGAINLQEVEIGSRWVSVPSGQGGNISDYMNTANNAPAGQEGRPGFNIDNAVDYLNAHANSSSQGACSRYVQNALVAGGIKADNPVQAGRKYGPLLEGWGFNRVTSALTNYSPIKGDIAVIQGYPGGTADKNGVPYGHIQMYNGSQWVSDFFQNRPFWPGGNYEKYKPALQIYRW